MQLETKNDNDLSRVNIYRKPAVWPWVLLAIAFAIALLFSAQQNTDRVGDEPPATVSPDVVGPGSGNVRGEPLPSNTPGPTPIPPRGAGAP